MLNRGRVNFALNFDALLPEADAYQGAMGSATDFAI